jgi:hypothetical protein
MFKSLLLTMVFFVTSATAPLASKADGALPGEFLYRIDRILEDMQLRNARTPEERVQLRLLFMQERLQETQSLLEQGDAINLPSALDGLDISLEELEEETLQADPESDGGVIEIMDEVFDGPEYNPDLVNQGFYCSNLDAYYHPVGYKIADQYADVEYADIMKWYCAGYGLGEVKLAYQISEKTEYSVDDLFAMRASGLGWGEIMHMPGRLEDVDAPDDADPDGTEEPVVTPEVEEIEQDDEGDPLEAEEFGEEPDYCTGAEPHPTGERLAFEYGVTYDEIMTWFCQGFGFGEIRLAYNIAYTMDVAIEEVFGLRSGGMGWGQVMQEYDITGNPKNPGNGNEGEAETPVDEELGTGGKPDSKPGGKPEDTPGGKPENTTGGKPETTPGGKPDKTTGKPDKNGKPNK